MEYLRFVNGEFPLIGMARPSVAKTPFSQRLTAVREALGYKERKAFAEKLNMHPDTLGGYERGDTFPDQQFLTHYKREFSVNLDWLITGDGRMFNSVADIISERIAADLAGPPVEKVSALETLRVLAPRRADGEVSATATDVSGMLAIPRFDEVRPSAGPGAMAASETPTTRMAFERRWLAEIGVTPDSAVILPAQGDSMEPTIMNGSPMLVDTSKTEIQSGYIYVIAVENDLLVKRIRRRLDGRIELISDNRSYDPETLDAGALQQLRVIGRVYAAVSKF